MHTDTNEADQNLKVAETYYQKMLEKDFEAMATCLDDTVQLIGPLSEMSGKEAVVSAAKGLSQILKDIQIRSKFAFGSQIMLAYDFFFPEPISKLRAAVLMDFKNQQITRIELFFDGRPFGAKQ